MSIFGRTAQSTPQSTSNSSRSSSARNDAPERLVDASKSANTTRINPPTIAMNSSAKKSPLSFTPPSMNAANNGSNEVRKLIVGRDIAMAGEITACDYLVVEGTLDATLRDGQRIEINESGLFRGAASVTDADIAGRFEGELSVRGRLRIRGSGKISGRIQYGELEIEAGGQVQGELIVLPPQSSSDLPVNVLGAFPNPANVSNDETFRTGTGN